MAISTQTPGRYAKENTLHIKHSESLKSRIYITYRFPPSLSAFSAVTQPTASPAACPSKIVPS